MNRTLRIPDDLAEALERAYRRTFPVHGLSRNSWYLTALEMLVEEESSDDVHV